MRLRYLDFASSFGSELNQDSVIVLSLAVNLANNFQPCDNGTNFQEPQSQAAPEAIRESIRFNRNFIPVCMRIRLHSLLGAS